MDISLVNKNKRIKRLNFRTGELEVSWIFYIDIENLPSEIDIRSYMEEFKRRITQDTMIPTEFFENET
jgi:hypothetical protein